MPNPTITPAWAGAVTTYTVDDSDFAAVDVRVTNLDAGNINLFLTVPLGATVDAILDPTGWTATGTPLLSVGGWNAAPFTIGTSPHEWNVLITAGLTPDLQAQIQLEDPDGSKTSGTLRLIFRGLGGTATLVERNDPRASFDRLLAGPTIQNLQVSQGSPVTEHKHVWLDGQALHTQIVHPNPNPALSPLPAIAAAWTPAPLNPVAVANFVPTGTHAEFDAPAIYANTVLNFQLKAAYDLDGGGLGSTTNPANQDSHAVPVGTVEHGMVVVIDRSGSMGGGFGSGGGATTRWGAATRAAHAWLDLFRAFRPGNLHKAAVVTFDHNACNTTASGDDEAAIRNPSTGVKITIPPLLSALSGLGNQTNLTLGNVKNCTPIGDGLMKAWAAIDNGLSGGGAGDKVASVLLLTDGYENAGQVRIVSTPGTALFSNARTTLPTTNARIGSRLFTLAVGQQVDAGRLNALGNGFYQMTSQAKEILPAFVDFIGQVLHVQTPYALANGNDPGPVNGPALYFPVGANEQRVAFLIPWENATDDIQIAWRAQNAPVSNPYLAVNTSGSGVQYFRRDRHGLVVADVDAVTGITGATNWRVQHIKGGVAQPLTVDAQLVPQEMRCLVDLVLMVEVGFDKRQYFIGEPIRLRCRVNNGGARVAGAKVEIDVARPGEGLGTFLALNAARYTATKPQPAPASGPAAQPVSSTASGPAAQPASSTASSAAAAAGDPPKGKGHMHATLLQILGMDALPVVVPPPLKLHDDGAHGDGAANDGDYSNVFTDTVKEGTYTFRFRIEGNLPDGSFYSRVFVRSTWVGVKPDRGHLGGVWTTIDAGSLLTFTPRTKSGEYLGPFQADVIAMDVSRGKFDGALVDNLDGSYSQRVSHDRAVDPIVSIEIQGVRMEPTGPGLGGSGGLGADGKNCWRLWVAAVRCTIRGILRALGLSK